MARKTAEKKVLILRGANGVLYRIPHSVLEQYVVPTEEFDSVLKALQDINPALAAQEAPPSASVPQVVINIFATPAGASIRQEGETRIASVGINPTIPTVTKDVLNIK